MLVFDFHSPKAAANLKKHKISFSEAMTVFDDPFAQTFPDDLHSDDEERWITLGVSSCQRLLFVSHLETDGRIRLIGARHAKTQEKNAYRQLNRIV